MKKPFNFSPDPSQKLNRTFEDNEKDLYEIVDEIEDSEKSESEEEISFLSVLRREAKEKEKNEALTDTQIMMQSQDDRTPEIRKVQCETKVETTVKITKTYFYMNQNGRRIHVRTEEPETHKMQSVTKTEEKVPHSTPDKFSAPLEESFLTNNEEKSQIGVAKKKRKRVESSSSESIIETQLGIMA